MIFLVIFWGDFRDFFSGDLQANLGDFSDYFFDDDEFLGEL